MKLSNFRTFSATVAYLSLFICASTQNLSVLLSKSTTCDEQCQQLSHLAIAYEQTSHANTPLDDFYSIPDSFKPSMAPGNLLRVEIHTNLTNYTVPSGLTMSRIMYTSQSLNGTVVPVSAFVLWPYAPFEYTNSLNSSRFPLVAWAHGTTGQFVECAPSNYRSLQYQFMTSYSLALEGFVVVATDYAGLGVTTLPDGQASHTWLAGPAGANDVAYAVEAVRKAFPDQLDENGPFVTMGHSQGGNVAWAFAERQAKSPVPGYRGTIAISPPTRVIDWFLDGLNLSATLPASALPLWVSLVLTIQPMFITAITAVYPLYNYTGLTPISYDRWVNVLKPLQSCIPTDNLVFADVSVDQLAQPGWTNNSFVQKWADSVAVSGNDFEGPLLLIAGENDFTSVDMLQTGADASCSAAKDQSLEFAIYGAMEHFPVLQASRMK